ncbi:DDE-type integrase/transposase/recombinase [Endozoicomonas sp. GU-1]|uniref:DDE-type integrase/transposase/recombinase n=1 Tax=Endozoicomonas sp. GU-1 TaxID=3009078 RepID=UPI0022B42C44|nr:DDE-type integrase/transposase/recombinase [Endozoicomonas sp. GU-1]WBA81854.1 DDE-type integrase/transposase/recombinase [Endozoicomonas sp. GU-1]WBA84808.1 DDE-type integrase/transposase/recombinase [Endozoicomonas sp. GU-1]
MFRVNEVLHFDAEKYRVLKLLQDHLVWIKVEDEDEVSFPSLVLQNELEAAIIDETLTRIDDPYEELSYLSPEQGTAAYVKRESNYQLIKPLVSAPDFYDPKVRSHIIQAIIKEKGSTKQTLYRLARRYWQRGQTPNALLPDYKNSGGKGKKRHSSGKKLGRPREYTPGVGAIVDAEVEKLFRIAIDRYVLNEKKRSFPAAHRKFKTLYENYFPDTPESEIPSQWQMMHFFKREYDQVEKIQKQATRIEFNKDIRPLSATANTQVLGPGSRFEIDATIADIYLVSDSDRGNIVGRPTVYLVIDVFSRMIAGFYVGFEDASYVAAMQALAMSMTDKVELCRQFGFEITTDDWPVVGVPDAILADRGELLGYQIESLERNFSVRIENTPPYRGDAKGIVERSFRSLQADFKPYAPGVVQGTTVKKRGGKNYRLDGKITITEFTEIILASILYHNQFHALEKYDRDSDIPSDLPMTPLSLWQWGVQHRTGRLRVVPEDALRVSLLPRTKATFSELGVCVFGVYYTSGEILKEGWLHRSSEVVRPETMDAAYDPRIADCIYLFPKQNTTKYWICNLTQRSRQFAGCSFWDVWQVTEQQKKTLAHSKLEADKKKRELEDLIEKKIKSAISLAPGSDHRSNAEKLSAIGENHRREKEAERQRTGYLPETKKKESAQVIPMTESAEDYSFPDHIDELFDEDD